MFEKIRKVIAAQLGSHPWYFLNIALPAIYVFALLAAYGYFAIAQFLMSQGLSRAASVMLGGVVAVVVPPVAGVLFVKCNVEQVMPRSQRQKVGHRLLLVGNAAALATTVLPVAVGYLTGHAEYGMFVWYSILVFGLNLILWPLGWSLATSKAKLDA